MVRVRVRVWDEVFPGVAVVFVQWLRWVFVMAQIGFVWGSRWDLVRVSQGIHGGEVEEDE